jgi:hypothetical protein
MEKKTPLVSAVIFQINFRKKMEKMNKSKALPYTVGTMLVLIGLSAVWAGGGLAWNPEGGMGLTVDLLADSPFRDFFYPGLILLIVNGIGSLVVAVMAFRNHRFAGIGTLFLGMAMIMWIIFQVYWMGWTSWLQPTFIIVGALEMALGVYLNEKHSASHRFFGRHRGSPAH